MFGKMIGAAISKIVGEGAGNRVVEYFDNKQKLKQDLKLTKLEGKIEAQKAKNQLRAKKIQQLGDWKRGMVEQMSGYKDEFVLVLISYPLFRAAVETSTVLDMFEALNQTPEWYRYLLVTIFLAIYGIKPVSGIWNKKKS